ncbi:hypothetical protein [Bacillus swezeyi]|uniref:hypothetical protein n=1 Tax=Bacillus swezeyi TaxID=1925020 RepID=UPI0027DD8BC0|nr:hypothetical protein [Bacillus swezeyi]
MNSLPITDRLKEGVGFYLINCGYSPPSQALHQAKALLLMKMLMVDYSAIAKYFKGKK